MFTTKVNIKLKPQSKKAKKYGTPIEGTVKGDARFIADNLGLSSSLVNQVIRGHRKNDDVATLAMFIVENRNRSAQEFKVLSSKA